MNKESNQESSVPRIRNSQSPRKEAPQPPTTRKNAHPQPTQPVKSSISHESIPVPSPITSSLPEILSSTSESSSASLSGTTDLIEVKSKIQKPTQALCSSPPPIPPKPTTVPATRKTTITKNTGSTTLPISQEKNLSLSPRRPSQLELRVSKLEAPSISMIEQVMQHRQPLIDKLRSLSEASAPFTATLARIIGYIARLEESSDKPIVILRELIPQLQEPMDLFDEFKRIQLSKAYIIQPNHPALSPLNGLIEHLANLGKAFNDLYPTLAVDVQALTNLYEEFRSKLFDSSITERDSLFIPNACVVGECVDFGLLGQEQGLKLHCRDQYKKKLKTNAHGMHAVVQHDGVFYKPNIYAEEERDAADLFIQPGMEYAIFSLLQLIAGEECVAAPTSWIKVSHVQKLTPDDKPDGYMERIIQTGLGIPGISLQDILVLVAKMQNLTRKVYRPDAIQAIRALQEREKKYHVLLEMFPALTQHFSQEQYFISMKHGAKGNIETLMNLEITKDITKTIQEILHAFSDEQKTYLLCKDPRGFGTLLTKSIDEKEEYTRRIFVVNLLLSHTFANVFSCIAILSECIEAVTQLHIDPLIGLFPYVKYFSLLFPNATPEELFDTLPTFLSRIDMTHFSATFIGHLLAKPTDAKPDNFQVSLARDPRTQAVISIKIIGIDNDRALAHPVITDLSKKKTHLIGIKCIFFLFKTAMAQPVTWAMRERLLSRKSIFWVLDWATLLYQHSQRCQTLIDQNVLLRSDQEETFFSGSQFNSVRAIDIPIKLSGNTLQKLHLEILEIQTVLATNPKATHQNLLQKLHPILDAYYDKVISEAPDIFSAYEIVHDRDHKPPLEEKVSGFDFSEHTKNHDDYITERTLSVGDAVERFFDTFDWETITTAEQFQVLEVCARQFPQLKLLKSRPINWLNQKLMESVYHGLSSVTKVLLQAGANVSYCDEAGRTALHVLLRRHERLKEDDFYRTLSTLIQCSTIDLNCYDLAGFTPLMTLVNNAVPDKMNVARRAIEQLVSVGVNIEKTDKEQGQSALDRAIERDLPLLFIALLRHRAGIRLNVGKAYGFVTKYLKDDSYQALMRDALDLLMQNNSEFSYRMALSTMSLTEPQTNALTIQGAQSGIVFLPADIVSQFLSETGEFHEKHSRQHGRRKVAQVHSTKNGTLFQMHLKEKPELPGMELAVGTLRRQLIGHGAPYTEVFKFTNPKSHVYPVLFSKTIKGPNFHNILCDPKGSIEVLSKLDHRSISEMIVTSIIINPDDDNPKNFIAEPISTTLGVRYRLACVDNDHGFVAPLTKDSSKHRQLQVKSIVFCLDSMHEPLHPAVITHFMSLDIEQVLREWLVVLVTQQECYQNLFTAEEKKRLLEQGSASSILKNIKVKDIKAIKKAVQSHFINPETPSVIPIPVNPMLIAELYHKLLTIKKALKKNPYLTGMQLLRITIPEIEVLYEEAFKSCPSPLDRFKALTATPYSKAVAGRDRIETSSQQILQNLDIPEEFISDRAIQEKYGPQQALAMLNLIDSQAKDLDEVLSDLQKGDFRKFQQLQLDKHKEIVVNRIDWMSLKSNTELQTKILLYLCNEKISFTRFSAAHCTTLTTAYLSIILKKSPDLKRLDLSYCSVVSKSTIKMIEKNTPKVEVLKLQGTLISEFTSTGLLNMRKLVLQDCLNLKRVYITGARSSAHSSLTFLSLDRSGQIKELDVNSESLEIFSCDGIGEECAQNMHIVNSKTIRVIIESTEKQSPKAQIARLIKLYLSGKYGDAQKYIEKIRSYDQNIPEIYANCAAIYYELESFSHACNYLMKAIQLEPSNPQLHLLLAKSQIQCKQYKEATASFDKALEFFTPNNNYSKDTLQIKPVSTLNLDSLRGGLFFERGKSKFLSGGHDGSDYCDDFCMALSCNFKLVDVLIEFIKSIVKLKNVESAINILTRLINIECQTSSLFFQRGQYYLDLGRYEEAIKDLNETIRLNPRDVSAHRNLEICRDKLSAIENSSSTQPRGVSLEKSDSTDEGNDMAVSSLDYINSGIEKAKLCSHEAALEDFHLTIFSNRRSAQAFSCRGASHFELGNYNLARTDYESAILINPNTAEIFNFRGRLYLAIGCFDEAMNDFDKSLELNPKYSLAFLSRAILQLLIGNYSNAIVDIDNATDCVGTLNDPTFMRLVLSYKAFIRLVNTAQNTSTPLVMTCVQQANTLAKEINEKNTQYYIEGTAVLKIIIALQHYARREYNLADSIFSCISNAIPEQSKTVKSQILALQALSLQLISETLACRNFSVTSEELSDRNLNYEARLKLHTRSLEYIEKIASLNPEYKMQNAILNRGIFLNATTEIFEQMASAPIERSYPAPYSRRQSLSRSTIWKRNKGLTLLNELKQRLPDRCLDHLCYVADVINLSSFLQNHEISLTHLTTTLIRAEYHLDSLLKKSAYGDLILACICGLDISIKIFQEDIKQTDHKFIEIENVALIGFSLGGQLDCIRRLLDNRISVDLDLFKQLIENALLGANVHVFQYLRTKFSAIFFDTFLSHGKNKVSYNFANIAICGGDDSTVKFVLQEFPYPDYISDLYIPSAEFGRWDLYRGFTQNTDSADKSIEDLSGKETVKNMIVSLHAMKTGNLDEILKLVANEEALSYLRSNSRFAVFSGDHNVFWFFVNHSFLSITQIFDNGDTIIHILSQCGHLSLLKELIPKLGDDFVYTLNNKKESALHSSAAGGHANVYCYLLDNFYNGKPTPIDSNGNTPEDVANKAGNVWFLKRIKQNKVSIEFNTYQNKKASLNERQESTRDYEFK
jgi:tetratricopeptide (TPR) repeat protein